MPHCENKTKAVVKIGGEIVHITENPPIEIQLIPEGGCYLGYVEFSYEYERYSPENNTYEGQWFTAGGGQELWSPIEDSFRLLEIPESNGFSIKIYCKGKKNDGCNDSQWYELVGYANERVKNAQITKFIIIEGSSYADSYLFKIINKDGVEEYVRRFFQFPEYEIICGCDIDTDLECVSDNELGFCCIPCKNISSKLLSLKNKLIYE